MKRLSLALLLAVGVLLAACDYIVSYTVTNETDRPVRTGWFYKPCSYEAERELRKGPLDDIIEPGTDLRIGGVAASQPECVVIKSEDESVILLQPYEDGGRYVVSGSQASSQSLQVTLAPRTGPAEKDRSTGQGVYVIFAVLGLGGLAALWITIRYFYGYYVSKSEASP